MPHPDPEQHTNAPPGSSLLIGFTPEQAQAVTHCSEGESLRWYANEVLVCEGDHGHSRLMALGSRSVRRQRHRARMREYII
jgi:hypothetical protein